METTSKCTWGRRCGPTFPRNPPLPSAVWTVAGTSSPGSGVGRRACILSRPDRTHALSTGPLDQCGRTRSVHPNRGRPSSFPSWGLNPTAWPAEAVTGM